MRAPIPQDPRIAIVDDDPAVLNALRFALEAEGYRVDTYGEAEGVLDVASTARFACLVVDQVLPGMTGLTLVRTLRGRNVPVPAILITTHPNAACKRAAADLGVSIVEKPLLGDALSEKIRSLSHRNA